jgi:uncharacterized protein YunC (DUF1805 family)
VLRADERRYEMDWKGLKKHRIDLEKPLLVIQGKGGLLGCGYLNVETFDKTGEAAAIVTGVADFDDMLAAKVVAVSMRAQALGVNAGMTGEEALAKLR